MGLEERHLLNINIKEAEKEQTESVQVRGRDQYRDQISSVHSRQ